MTIFGTNKYRFLEILVSRGQRVFRSLLQPPYGRTSMYARPTASPGSIRPKPSWIQPDSKMGTEFEYSIRSTPNIDRFWEISESGISHCCNHDRLVLLHCVSCDKCVGKQKRNSLPNGVLENKTVR